MKPIVYLSILCLCSCATQNEDIVDEKMPLVVEAWIDEGEAPIVMVTHAIDLTVDAPSFDDYVEKWGRVTIYDNDKPYILTGRIKSGYTPSLVFTSTRLKGKTGHTYRLTIETETDFAESEVELLPTPLVKAVTPIKEEAGYSLLVELDSAEGVLQFQTRRLDDEARFYPAFCGTVAAADIPAEGFKVTRGVHAAYDKAQAEAFSDFFVPGEIIMLKVCRITPDLLPFWQDYDQTVSLSGNLFLSMTQGCQGNVNGALGYFSANGAETLAIRIPE